MDQLLGAGQLHKMTKCAIPVILTEAVAPKRMLLTFHEAGARLVPTEAGKRALVPT